MKIRDSVFLVIGGLLVISGMVLNELIDTNVFAQENQESKVVEFDEIKCKNIFVDGIVQSSVSLSDSVSVLGELSCGNIVVIDDKKLIAYLGRNPKSGGATLDLLSGNDKKCIGLSIDENGGRLDAYNKLGENVVRLVVGADGGGLVDLRDKHGYKK